MISETIKASPVKLCTVVVLLEAYQNAKKFQKLDLWRHNDVVTEKQWENSDLRETKQIICHSKGNDESFLKM